MEIKKQYSPSTQGFYLDNAPDDAVDVSPEDEALIRAALAIYSSVEIGDDGEWLITPREIPAPELWLQYQARARDALTASDVSVLRCVEAGVAVPPPWIAYRKALRGIISASTGDPLSDLPIQPEYPEGT